MTRLYETGFIVLKHVNEGNATSNTSKRVRLRYTSTFTQRTIQMYQRRYFTLTLVLLLTLTTNAVLAADPLAIKSFRAAISACEQGLQSDAPKSRGSLLILQSLLSRYQRNKDAALAKEGSLKDSTSERYTGHFFVEKTFKEAYAICESDFVPKVSQAEAAITKQLEERQARQAEQKAVIDDLMKKVEAAQQQVTAAVQICTGFLRAPIPNMLQSAQYKEYQAAKAKALGIYPAIVKQFHDATYVDSVSGEEVNASKTVQSWFDYCEDMFENPPLAADKVGPPSPPAAEVAPAKKESGKKVKEEVSIPSEVPVKESGKKAKEEVSTPSETPSKTPAVTSKPAPAPKELDKKGQKEEVTIPTEEAPAEAAIPSKPAKETPSAKESEVPAAGTDEEKATDEELAKKEEAAQYQKALSQVRGDRLKTLEENQRVPEYVDDEDNDIQKANIWQYEDEKKCTTYTFKGDKLLKSKATPGECPLLDQ